MTGRLASGLTFGVLSAVTGRERVRTYNVSSNAFSDYEVSPRTGYGVIALQQEFGQAARTSAVANLMLTGVERALPDTGLLATVVNRRAYTGLADYRIRWRGGQYDASVFAGYSYIEGDSAAILQQQRSSRRYYQRPDYETPRLDPSRTSLFGWKAGINHSKVSGKHWLWDIDLYAESPGLELNDIGRLGNGDDRGIAAGLRYRETTPGKLLRNYEVGLSGTDEYNYESVRTFTILSAYMGTQLWNYWQVNADAAYFPRWQSDNLTRGGPLMESPANWSGGGSLSSRPGARTRWRVGFSASRDELGGWGIGPNAGFSFRPGSQWEVSIDPRFSKGEASRQYIATLAGGGAATFGGRYIFSRLDRTEASARIRVNYAITPDLTLETYAEPFASSGRFFEFGELQAARSHDLRIYGTDGTTISAPDAQGRRRVTDGSAQFNLSNLDFNVRSFRSNVVLRWEWRPGSTLYAVWQQNRGSRDPIGDAIRASNVFDGLRAPGDNFFALKMNYWLPVR